MKCPRFLRSRMRRSPSLVTYFGSAYWLVAMVIVWASLGLFLWYSSARTEQQIRATARAVAETVAATTAPAWSDKPAADFLSQSLSQAATLPDIAFVQARLPGGSVLATAGDAGIPSNQVWTESAPVTYENRHLGTVEVAILRTSGQGLLLPMVQVALAASLLATALSALAAAALAYRTTQPLRALQSITTRWEQPQIINQDWERGPREVRELGRAIMAMRSQALARTNQLAEQVMQRTQQLTQAYNALDESFLGTAAALAQALDARDHLTANHANRTAHLVSLIAQRVGFSGTGLRTVVLAATLHDIGKIGIPEHILTKPGRLTPEEMAIMRLHPVISANILERVAGMQEVARLVRHHHERWDGKGYPDGLKGTEIPLGSRIIALADTVEAMSARRHYRDPLPPDAILAEIRRCSGSQFDPDVVKAGWDEIVRVVNQWCRTDLASKEEPPPIQTAVPSCNLPGGRS